MEFAVQPSVPALAYLGDCVLELLVREYLVASGLSHSSALNRAALAFVKASAQADAMDRVLPFLTEEEATWYRRGRNSGHLNFPKSASPAEYRRATGMEVLFGHLHAAGRDDRARELFALAYDLKAPSHSDLPAADPTENSTKNEENDP